MADGIQRWDVRFMPTSGKPMLKADSGGWVRFSDVQAKLYAAEEAAQYGVRLWEYLNALGPEPGSDLRQALDRFQEALRVFDEEPEAVYRSVGKEQDAA